MKKIPKKCECGSTEFVCEQKVSGKAASFIDTSDMTVDYSCLHDGLTYGTSMEITCCKCGKKYGRFKGRLLEGFKQYESKRVIR